MNVLILNGSPRKHGNIARMLSAIESEVVSLGGNVTALCISDLQVKPCTGCMACRKKGSCVLPEDDAQLILRRIQACDLLVIGSPCYWGNIPGQLKILFDRLVYGLMGESKSGFPLPLHKGKQAILVATCTTPFPCNLLFRQSRGTIRALREIVKWSGFKVAGTLEVAGTREKEVSQKELDKCRKMVRKYVGL